MPWPPVDTRPGEAHPGRQLVLRAERSGHESRPDHRPGSCAERRRRARPVATPATATRRRCCPVADSCRPRPVPRCSVPSGVRPLCSRAARGRRTRHRPGAAHPGDARSAGCGLPPPGAAVHRGRHRPIHRLQLPRCGRHRLHQRHGGAHRPQDGRDTRAPVPVQRHALHARRLPRSGRSRTAAPRSASYELTSTSLPVRGAHRSTTSTRASPEPVCSGPPSFRADSVHVDRLGVGDVRGPRPGAEGLHRLGERAVRRHAGHDRDGCRSRSSGPRGPRVRPSTTRLSSTGPWSEAPLAQMEWSARTPEFEFQSAPLGHLHDRRRPARPGEQRLLLLRREPQPDRGVAHPRSACTHGPAVTTYSKQSSRTSATLSFVTSVGGTTTSDGTSGSTRSAKPRPCAIRRAMLTADPAIVGL